MTLEEYIQFKLQNIEDIKSLVGENIFPFIASTNAEKCFIRWHIITEEDAVDLLNGFSSLKKAEVQISVFANTLSNARLITNAVVKTFNNSNKFSNIRCSQATIIQPTVEDNQTVHYPIRITFFYNI